MRFTVILIAALSALLLGIPEHLVGIAAAGTQEFDFEDPAQADFWTPIDKGGDRIGAGEWKIEDGAYHQTITDSLYHKSVTGSSEWSNCTVEFDMIILEGGAVAGVVMRADEKAANGYRFIIHSKGAFVLGLWQEDNYVASYLEFAAPAQVGLEYHIKCSIEDWIFTAWVDDEEIMEHELQGDQRLFENGGVALINYSCHASYDNIIITGPEVRAFSVEASGKLPTLWGQIKQ